MEASDHLYIDNAHVISYNRHSERFSCDGKLGKISCDRSFMRAYEKRENVTLIIIIIVDAMKTELEDRSSYG